MCIRDRSLTGSTESCFAVLDGAVGKLNAELEEGSVPLRANRVKADFFALNFGEMCIRDSDGPVLGGRSARPSGQAGAADDRTAEKRDRREGGADGAEPEHGAV